jgi:hypothetical protein
MILQYLAPSLRQVAAKQTLSETGIPGGPEYISPSSTVPRQRCHLRCAGPRTSVFTESWAGPTVNARAAIEKLGGNVLEWTAAREFRAYQHDLWEYIVKSSEL